MTQYLSDSIFWIELEKIEPNPYQPRRDFDEQSLKDLADSIRQYGVLQPLVVTRKETEKEEGGLRVTYELIAGERRLRAAKIAEIAQLPAVIRSEQQDPREKLELAIIENLQREDLNPVDRARAFARLVEEFGFKHSEVAKKVGRSREYISNSLRLLELPEEIMSAVRDGKLTEGHARTMMMLSDRPEEQKVLFKEIIYKKLSVREAEGIARQIAHERVRKKEHKPDPQISELEGKISNTLGTRVQIQQRENGGKLVIDFFSNEDLEDILNLMEHSDKKGETAFMDRFIAAQEKTETQTQQKTEKEPASAESKEQTTETNSLQNDTENVTEMGHSDHHERNENEEQPPHQYSHQHSGNPEQLSHQQDSQRHETEVSTSQEISQEQTETAAEPQKWLTENTQDDSEEVSAPQTHSSDMAPKMPNQEQQEATFHSQLQPETESKQNNDHSAEESDEHKADASSSSPETPSEAPSQEASSDEAFIQNQQEKKREEDERDLYSIKNFTI